MGLLEGMVHSEMDETGKRDGLTCPRPIPALISITLTHDCLNRFMPSIADLTSARRPWALVKVGRGSSSAATLGGWSIVLTVGIFRSCRVNAN